MSLAGAHFRALRGGEGGSRPTAHWEEEEEERKIRVSELVSWGERTREERGGRETGKESKRAACLQYIVGNKSLLILCASVRTL